MTTFPAPAAAIPLLPGRECGDCDVCCVALTIIDPELRKPQGVRCANLTADRRCGIYAGRPMTCRTFDCGWRQLRWVRETLRPDRSDVLVRLRQRGPGKKAGKRADELAVIFTILSERGLDAPGLIESLAAAIAAGVRVFLEVPGEPGYTSGLAEVNAVLADAVRFRDKAVFAATLRRCWEQGRIGKGEKVDVG